MSLADFFQSHVPDLIRALTAQSPDTGMSPLSQIQSSLNGISAAASGNPEIQQQAAAQSAATQQAARSNLLRQQELNSELANQSLQRQRAQLDVDNYQTPAQKQAMELDTQGKLLDSQRSMAPPQRFSVLGPDGQETYYDTSYSPLSKSYQTVPATVTQKQTVSDANNPTIPYRPGINVTQDVQKPLTGVSPEVLKARLDLANSRAKTDYEWNPDILVKKLALSSAERQARANTEMNAARGSNAALANVPAHLIAPATEAATKAGQEYAQAKSVSDRLAAMMAAAKNGNVESYQLLPQEGALQITTSQGVHRINQTEINQYADGGSIWQRLVGHIGKNLSGKSIPDSVLNDMGEMQQIQADGAKSKYANSLRTINQNYGSSFQPVEMDSMGASNRGTPTAPATPPPGATMKVPGSDGKLHWSDGKQDLGVVQ